MHFRIVALTLILGSSPIATPAVAGDYPPAGATGYGETVFEGGKIERFEVVILGVLEKAGGTGDTILARLSGGPLEHTGVLQGMSGSPVWVDGELIGAVAGTWSFVKEPIAAIRPIGEMRQLADFLDAGGHPTWQPGQDTARAPVGGLGLSPQLLSPTTSLGDQFPASTADDTEPALDPWRPTASRTPSASALSITSPASGLAWSASGFAPSVHAALERQLGATLVPAPMSVASNAEGAAAGDEASTEGATLEAGDAVAVLLVDGDAQLASVGTVTERVGDTVLAFGHPFLGAGPLSLPMAKANVITLLPSQQISAKISTPGPEVGALLLDRAAGVSGRLGVKADMLPVSVVVIGPDGSEQRFRYRVARQTGLTSSLAYWTVQSSLLVDQDIRTEATADLRVELDIAGEEPLITESTVTGLDVGGQLAGELMLPMNLLSFNPEQALRIESLDVRVDLRRGIQGSSIGRTMMHPAMPERGETVRVRVELLPYRQDPRWVELDLTLPPGLPDGRYAVHVSDGALAFQEEIQRAGVRWRRPGLRQIREALSYREPANTLVAVLYGAPQGAVVRGVELERLPGSVRGVLARSHGAPSAEGVLATPLARSELRTEFVLDGSATLIVQLGPVPEAPKPNGKNGNTRR